MINESMGYQYIDAVLALVPLAKFYPSNDGTFENVEWVDERTQPTAEAVADKLAELKATESLYYVRKERDTLIAETDWVSGDDVPQALKDKWYPYRQALRDITQNYDNIETVVWPVKPE
jgi:hypothetical protein